MQVSSLAGDFNSRTSNLHDFIAKDNLDFILGRDAYYESDDFDLERKSKDLCTNSFGLSLLQLCKTYAIHIFNGRLHQDQEGEFTCTANEGASVVDYIIASTCLFNICSFFEIGERTESVHFPVICEFGHASHNIDASNLHIHESPNEGQFFLRFKWSEEKKNNFMYQFRNEMFTFFSVFTASLLHGIDSALQSIIDLYQTCASSMLVRKNKSQNKSQPQWWDNQCQELKKDKMSALHQFRFHNSRDSLKRYKMNRNRFKNVIRQKKANFFRRKRDELISSRSNPLKFWKLIKQARASKRSYDKITDGEWLEYFKIYYLIQIGKTLPILNVLILNKKPFKVRSQTQRFEKIS